MIKHINKIIYLIIFLAFTFFSYQYFQSHIFALHFVDEDENIVAGYYMGKDEKLYKDIFSHKQPLPAVLSMFEQKIQKPNSLFLLIKRHREIIYFYSIAWTAVLIITLGLPGLIFGIMFEIIKQFQLGNMFLSESLVVFPLVYSFEYLWKMFTSSRHSGESRNPENKISAQVLFSLSLSLILFLQFTLIPYVLIVILLLIIGKKFNLKSFLILNSCFLTLIIFCFPFVDYSFYFDNLTHALRSIYIGGSAAEGPLKMLYYSFLRPFTVILEMGKSQFGIFTGILSIGYLLSFFYLFIIRKNLRPILIITYFFLGLSSLRIVYPDKTLYSGFHGLPWLGALLFVTVYQIYLIVQLLITNYPIIIKRGIRNKQLEIGKLIPIIVIVIFSLFLIHNSYFLIQDYYRYSDRKNDQYVNYSRLYTYGQIIRVLSAKGDKVMVLPAEQLIYWQSGLPHASRFLYVYLFVDPQYKLELYDYWNKTPPAFLYDEQNMALFKKWWPDYIRIKKENNVTPIFIRKDKIKKLEEWQLNEAKRMDFSFN